MQVSAFETQLTRQTRKGEPQPSRSMKNRKPFRTKSQKADARKTEAGIWRSTAPVSYHL